MSPAQLLIQSLHAPSFPDEEKTRLGRMLNVILIGVFVIAIVFFLSVGLFGNLRSGQLMVSIGLVLALAAVGMQALLRLGQVRPAALLLTTLIFGAVSYATYTSQGVRDSASAGYLVVIVLAGLLLGWRMALAFSLISISAVAGFHLLESAGMVTYPQTPSSISDVIGLAAFFTMTVVMLFLASRGLNQALQEARQLAHSQVEANRSLQSQQATLEMRTRDLTLAVEIGQRLSAERDLGHLLSSAAELIRARFDLYYVQIYLVDDTGQFLDLRAGTGSVGEELLRRQHRLPVDFSSINGMAVADHRVVVVADTQTSIFFRPNPYLPETRSELAVPLISGQTTLGVLDLQSSVPDSFDQATLKIFEMIAGQLAVAAENARLLAEAQSAQAALQEQTRRLSRQNWQEFMDAVHLPERVMYTYDPRKRRLVSDPAAAPNGQTGQYRANIQVGGQVIGNIRLTQDANQEWSGEEEQLLRAVANQIAQQVENLRLLAEAERYRYDAEQAASRLTQSGWQAYLQGRQMAKGFAYDCNEVAALASTQIAADADLVEPLLVNGQPIGALSFLLPEDREISPEMRRLVQAVGERLSEHVENLRLFEQTQKRAGELATIAQVSTTASSTLDAQELLQNVVDLTKESFHLYHAHIYLFDEQNEVLRLAVGAGTVGMEMVSQGWSIPLAGKQSLVARAARTHQGTIANDVREEPGFLPNPMLPETRAEMALPLMVGETLLGVFDLQSDQPGRFTEEDVQIYITLAAQVAVALQNAELYKEQLIAVARLRELDHVKSAFLANMSHELRTPLNSILGFTQVISEGLDGEPTEAMLSDLQRISRNGEHLLSLINDVLDMAKIEAGRLTLNLEPVDLGGLLQDVLDTSSGIAREKGLVLHLENHLQAGQKIEADRLRLRQILINLVGNALKFTEQGGITLQVDLAPAAGKVLIKVVDTGIGIPPERLESIFEAFSQVDTSTTRKAGGTGLGLPISRKLVELHGGRLWAASLGERGGGSTFFLELPSEGIDQ